MVESRSQGSGWMNFGRNSHRMGAKNRHQQKTISSQSIPFALYSSTRTSFVVYSNSSFIIFSNLVRCIGSIFIHFQVIHSPLRVSGEISSPSAAANIPSNQITTENDTTTTFIHNNSEHNSIDSTHLTHQT